MIYSTIAMTVAWILVGIAAAGIVYMISNLIYKYVISKHVNEHFIKSVSYIYCFNTETRQFEVSIILFGLRHRLCNIPMSRFAKRTEFLKIVLEEAEKHKEASTFDDEQLPPFPSSVEEE